MSKVHTPLPAGPVRRGVHGNDFLGFRWSEGRMWDKKYSPVAPRTRFLLFLRFRLIDPPSVRRPQATEQGLEKNAKTHFCVFGMADHGRQGLGTPPLERGTVDHAHQPSNGTLQPAFRLGGRARCSGTCTRSTFPDHIRTHTGCPVHGTLDVRCGTPPPWLIRAICHASGRAVSTPRAPH